MENPSSVGKFVKWAKNNDNLAILAKKVSKLEQRYQKKYHKEMKKMIAVVSNFHHTNMHNE